MRALNTYDKIVYLCHGYGGSVENLNDITSKLKRFTKLHPNYLFISPVNMYNELYDIVDYNEGLDMCLYLLTTIATEMWVCDINYNESTGCKAEIEVCKERGIPVKYFVSDRYYAKEPFIEEESVGDLYD